MCILTYSNHVFYSSGIKLSSISKLYMCMLEYCFNFIKKECVILYITKPVSVEFYNAKANTFYQAHLKDELCFKTQILWYDHLPHGWYTLKSHLFSFFEALVLDLREYRFVQHHFCVIYSCNRKYMWNCCVIYADFHHCIIEHLSKYLPWVSVPKKHCKTEIRSTLMQQMKQIHSLSTP